MIARHLKHFGFAPTIFYPKKSSQSHLVVRVSPPFVVFPPQMLTTLPPFSSLSFPSFPSQNLAQQDLNLGIPFVVEMNEGVLGEHQLVVDAIFGFSFKGAVRAPFDAVIRHLRSSTLPVVAIDVPSGWDVEKGDLDGTGLLPDTLISLGAPKLCARHFNGKHHFLGGRFVPP